MAALWGGFVVSSWLCWDNFVDASWLICWVGCCLLWAINNACEVSSGSSLHQAVCCWTMSGCFEASNSSLFVHRIH